MSKFIAPAVLALLSCSFVVPAMADADRVSHCVTDNADEGQTEEILKSYCACMDEQMKGAKPDESVTAWEKDHKSENESCSKKAGWKEEDSEDDSE
jgi:hypothetical protein